MKKLNFVPLQKKKLISEIKDVALVLLGCIILAIGDALFIEPCGVISGGVSSVGIIVNYWIEGATGFKSTDIVVAICHVVLWTLGLIVMGKKFSLHTLIAMITYPVVFALIYRFGLGKFLGMEDIYAKAIAGGPEGMGSLLLCATIGGMLCGAGTSLAYFGNGSTGGFNVVSAITARYTDIKEGTSSLIIDSSLIILGAIVRFKEPNNFILACVGILCAIVCAITIQIMYVNSSSFVICDVISEKHEEIKEYVINEMEHTTTMFDTVGGYTGEKRKMLRAVIYESETAELQQFIASVDPKAFVSFSKAKTINGEGFQPFYIRHKKKKENLLKKEKNMQQKPPEIESNGDKIDGK